MGKTCDLHLTQRIHKGEGILEMQLKFLISWFWVNENREYPRWAWHTHVDPLKESPAFPEVRDSLSVSGTEEASGSEAQPQGNEFSQQSEGTFPCQASSWECGPLTLITAYWHPEQHVSGRSCTNPWPTETPEITNMCCFTPLKLLCSKHKQKLVHNLVKINTFFMAPPHSHRQADCCSKLLPTQDLLLLKILALVFSWRGSLKPYSPRSYWELFTLPISGQTSTYPSRITSPIKLVLKSPGRIKPVSSVVSETSEENSIIIFRRSGCNFLFTCLLNGRGQVKQKDSLQR